MRRQAGLEEERWDHAAATGVLQRLHCVSVAALNTAWCHHGVRMTTAADRYRLRRTAGDCRQPHTAGQGWAQLTKMF